MGVSKNNGTPKWMVKIMENPIIQWMIWGVSHIFGNTRMVFADEALVIELHQNQRWFGARELWNSWNFGWAFKHSHQGLELAFSSILQVGCQVNNHIYIYIYICEYIYICIYIYVNIYIYMAFFLMGVSSSKL